jgi:ATP:corrinoid adenosyltransferase
MSQRNRTTLASRLEVNEGKDYRSDGDEVNIEKSTPGLVIANSGPSKTTSTPAFMLVIVAQGMGWDYDDWVTDI